MKPLPVFFTGLAEEDLDEIEDFISTRDPAAAARVRTAIVRQSLQLRDSPAKGMALMDLGVTRKLACGFGLFRVLRII